MNPVSFICFSGCLGIIISCFRKNADVLSPGRVFGFTWCLAIGLTQLKFSAHQYEWSAESWIQVLLGPVAFLVGTFVAYVLNLESRLLLVEDIRMNGTADRINEKRLFVAISMFFILYVLAYAIIYFVKGVDPVLFALIPGKARREFTLFGLGMFLHNVVLVVFLTVVYHLFVQEHRSAKRALKVMSVISILTYFLLLQRFQLALAAVMCFATIYYLTQHLRPRKFAIYAAVITGLFSVVSTLRSTTGDLFIYYLYRNSQMRFPREYAILTEPYMYVAMNLENLARGIEKLDHFTYGTFSLDFVFATTGLKHWLGEYFHLDPTPYLVSSYNTYTSYWSFYRDFGPLGVTAIPLMLGLGVGMVYYQLRTSPSLWKVTVYGACVFVMAISFFNNPLQFLWFVYNMVAILAVLCYVRSPQLSSIGAV